ncbi:MAG: secretin N-terminal domain-containing protein [Armatimonadota bacterium]
MPDKLAALRDLLAASRYGATDHRAKITLDHLDARAVAGWIYWKASQRELGEIEPGDLRRIQVLPDTNSLLVTGDPTALDRLQVLVESIDVPHAATISLSCVSVETSQPQRLLCQPRAPNIVEMPDGSHFDPAAQELDVGKLCPVAPEYADESLVLVNPYVDTDELDEMLEEGVAEMPWEPRFIERAGLAGTVTFQCEHTTASGRPGLRLAALVGANGLITCQVSLRCSDEGPGARTSATVQYVAFPGQTVAVGVVPTQAHVRKMTVLLITADTVDRHARRRAHARAHEHTRDLRQTPAPTREG